MNLRTSFNIAPSPYKISHQSKLLAIGSCFATMVGKHMKDRKYDLLVNPFGTIFNPISVFTLLQNSISELELKEEEFIQHQEKWIHYQYHSSISADSKEELLTYIQNLHGITFQYLREASHLFITLGTAFIYEHKPMMRPVANCHKQPSSLFSKRLLTISEMAASFEQLYEQINAINPGIHIILTVSPVRHIKEGVPENQLSKSLLRVLVDQLMQYGDNVHYFPSYELMMDDLRDYRFYKEDLIHPTEQAEQYIYQKFEEAYIAQEDRFLDEKVIEINKSLSHRPFNPNTQSHKKFLKNLLDKITQMPKYLDFSKELDAVKRQLE
jgi:hypothetical protein